MRTSFTWLVSICLLAAGTTVPAIAQEQQPECEGMAATIVGTEGPDVITGTPEADVIVGLGGDDVIDGAGGLDRICGDAGADQITDGDGYALSGGDGNDVITADRDGTTEFALFAVLGGEGDDTLRSTPSTTSAEFIPGPGDDIIDGQGGNDLLRFSGSESAVTVNLSQGTATGEGSDQLSGIERVHGSAHDDTIVGSDEPDLIDGGKGSDTMRGLGERDTFLIGRGDDDVVGGPGRDWVRLVDTAGYLGTTNLARGTMTADRVHATLSGIENVQGGRRLIGDNGPNRLYAGEGGDFIDGKRGPDVIKPGGRWDTVYAGRGDDYVSGCAGGNDRINLGPGHDVVDPVGPSSCGMSPGRDRINGGPGRDLLTYELLRRGLSVNADLERGACFSCEGEPLTTLNAIEDIRGSDGNDRLAGNDLANRLYGLDGNDTLNGRGGRDRVSGGPGRDNCVEGEYRTGCE